MPSYRARSSRNVSRQDCAESARGPVVPVAPPGYSGDMDTITKRLIALVAGCLANDQSPSTLYDTDEQAQHRFSGDASESGINIFDHDAQVRIHGSASEGRVSFFNPTTRGTTDLTLIDKRFTGYDRGSGKHFYGEVLGDTVRLCDQETGHYTAYRLIGHPHSLSPHLVPKNFGPV